MTAEAGPRDLSGAVPELLSASSWPERARILDASSELLTSDAADGMLLVIRWAYDHDRPFQEMVDEVRWLLDLAGGDRLDGSRRAVSDYFRERFSEPGPYAGAVTAQPPQLPSGDEYVQLVTQVTTAFIFAASWEERRNICLAYPGLFSSQEPERFVAAFREATGDDSRAAVYDRVSGFLASVRANGVDGALVDPPSGAFLRFGPAVDLQLTFDEAVQDALISYLDTPTWRRRRRLLVENGDLLVSPTAAAVVAAMLDRYRADPGKLAALGAVAESLARARRGLDGFADGLPPAVVSLDTAPLDAQADDETDPTNARQLSTARRVVNYVGPRMPWAWAGANLGLSRLLTDYPVAELRPVYAEEALRCSAAALSVFTGASAPEEWRSASEQRGAALVRRVRGDQAANVEAAIAAFEEPLRLHVRDGRADDAGRLAAQLAEAFRLRRDGVRASNLETAYGYGKSALAVFSRERAPDDWAWVSTILAGVCAERLFGDPSANRREAIDHLEGALTVLDRRTSPQVWGAAHQLVGAIYPLMGEPRDSNLKRATDHLTKAMEVFGRDVRPWHWAVLQHSLGVAYARLRASTVQGRATAVRHFRSALEVFTPDYSWDRRRTLRELGAIHFRGHRWEEAAAALAEAAALGAWLEDQRLTTAGRYAEIREVPNVHERLAYCLLKLGRPADAALQLDLGKTRFLRESLEQDAVDDVAEQLSIDDITSLVPEGGALLAPILTSQGSAVIVLPGKRSDVTLDDILWLDDVTDSSLRELLLGTPAKPGWLTVNEGWLRARDALTAAEDAAREDGAGDGAADQLAIAEAEYATATEAWDAAMEDLGSGIWTILMGPIHDRLEALGLQEGARLLVLPSKWLSLVPLHAAWRDIGGSRRYVLDDFELLYAPSAFATSVSRRRSKERGALDRSLLAVADPTEDLRFARSETDAVARLFAAAVASERAGDDQRDRVRVLPGDAATPDAVVREAAGRTHLHFACHASFDWFDPAESSLVLAGGERMSVSNIASRLSLDANRLITLSACETGVIESEELPNEYLGLPGALLHAGAAVVVSSLWSVDDEATSVLMEAFYRYQLEAHLDVADALRSAQLRLRDGTAASLDLVAFWERREAAGDGEAAERIEFYRQRADEHVFQAPFFWAGFTVAGS